MAFTQSENNARKERAIELANKGNLVGGEIDEFAGLSKEFPETVAAQAKPVVEPVVKPAAPVVAPKGGRTV